MTSSIAKVAKYLTNDQKHDIALSLTNLLTESAESSSLLAELISLLDTTTLESLQPQLLKYVNEVSSKKDSDDYGTSVAFLLLLESLCEDFLTKTITEFKCLLGSSLNFVTTFRREVERFSGESDPTIEVSKQYFLNKLEFLSLLASKRELETTGVLSDIDQLLWLFLGHSDDEISSSCLKALRWRVNNLAKECNSDVELCDYIWTLLFGLIRSGTSKSHSRNAYIMWLRLLNSPFSELENNVHFQKNYLSQEFYWNFLQKGLVSPSHEIRKFSLSIVQLSLKKISTSFATEIISWDMKKKEALLKEWSRFTTLYEILGIDTSLHQTQAAIKDILGLITPESLIHSSWGFCLLSTGFQASIDTVRKFSAQILLSIHEENLFLLQYALPFLEDTFLPYLIQSRHFSVRSSEAGNRFLRCEYGEKLTKFLSHILTNLKTDEEVQRVSLSIFRVLERNKEAYDGVRVYCTMGLWEGLKRKNVLKFGQHDHLLVNLFDDFSEGFLYSRTVQTLNLRLILKFQLENLSDFSAIITKFVKFNGYEILNEHINSVYSYIVESGFDYKDMLNTITLNQIPENEQIAFMSILCKCTALKNTNDFVESIILSKSDSFLSELIASGVNLNGASKSFENRVAQIWSKAVSGELLAGTYRSLNNSELSFSNLFISQSPLNSLYASILEDISSEDYGTLVLSVEKFRFFNKCASTYKLPSSLDSEDLIALHENLFSQSSNCAKSVTDFYKLKDEAFGEYHSLLSIFVDQNTDCYFDLSSIMPVIHFGSTHYTTLLSICKIIYTVLNTGNINDDTLREFILLLSESIIELDAERFKLSGKDVHIYLIRIFCHPVLLMSTLTDDILNEAVSAFFEVIMFNGSTRRGLFTRLTKGLIEFQISNPIEFENIPFLCAFLVRAATHRQVQHNTFKLEEIVGEIYDTKLSPSKESSIYRDIYGENEISAKVRVFAMLNSIKTCALGKSVLDFVFDESDPLRLFNTMNSVDGFEEFSRSQIAKVVVSVSGVIDIDYSFKHYFKHYLHVIENDPSPLVRAYFEWVIASLLLQKPERALEVFTRLKATLVAHELRPTLVTIYERILFLMAKSLDGDARKNYLTKLATIVLPAASTNKAVTRHFSMSLATSIYEEIHKNNIQVDESVYSILDNMYKCAVSQEAFGQHRSGNALLWDVVKDLTLVNISGGLLLRLNDRDVDYITSGEFYAHLSRAEQDRLNYPIGEDDLTVWVKNLKANRTKALQESNNLALSPLQTKSGAWSTVMDVDQSDRGAVRSDLIVVASLVDKPPNLGGICRLCDVLGAGLMTIHDLKIKNHPQFKSVAVTADYWMPMIEVPPQNVVDYLREKKSEGYTLIGLEQTDKSVVLSNDLKFPKKSIILLGREKEGVPGELLAELDFCVEIKQVGVVRSMNIQTATAVIVHAYSSQNC